jgi:hypothetical protein
MGVAEKAISDWQSLLQEKGEGSAASQNQQIGNR